MQGLQLESVERLAAKQRAEKELATLQEVNRELQAVAAQAEVTRQELVPAGELMAARSALGAAEQRVAVLERELREAKEEATSANGRAKAAVAAAEEDRKVSEALIVGLQDDHSSLQSFITGLARPLLGECVFPDFQLFCLCFPWFSFAVSCLTGHILGSHEEANSLGAKECVSMLVDSATLSATCIRAYLQEMSPTEVIPSDLVEVWEYLEKAPAVMEFMTRSAFRRGASTALSLGLAHFPEDFDLDDVTSGYPSSTGSVDLSEVLKLQERAAAYSERVWAMGDLLPYQETVVAPNDPEPPHRDFKVEQPFRAAMAGELTTYPSHPYTAFIRRRRDSGASSSKPAE